MFDTKSLDFKNTGKLEQNGSFLLELLKTESLDCNLVELIYQFLLTYDFESTAKCLLVEANKLGYKTLDQSSTMKDVIPEDACTNILSRFMSKDWKQFFKLWTNSVPERIKSTMDYKILTMKLRVHFAMLPIRSDQQSKSSDYTVKDNIADNFEDDFETDSDVVTAHEIHKAECMNQLEQYLKTDGRNLINCASFIAFFALPYLEDPINDSTVSHIFTTSWVDELTVNLKIFLVKHREIISPKRSHLPSQEASIQSITTPNSRFNKEQIEQNLKILDSLDSDDAEITKVDLNDSLRNNRLEIVETRYKTFGEDYMRIIPNDRDIPNFFEEQEIEDELSYQRKTKVKITQTRIQGVKNMITSLATDELSRPVKVLDPEILLRSPKKSTKKYEEQVTWAMTCFHNIHGNYQRLKLRFHQLHSNYYKLMDITKELTGALESSARGNPVSLQQVLKSCIIIFPDLFNRNLRVDSKENSSLKSEDEAQQNQTKISHRFDFSPMSPKSIDFKKIKMHLRCGSLKTKLLLLQALRWKITLSQHEERDQVIHEYIGNDLLSLCGNIASSVANEILPSILYPVESASKNVLQKTAARLLNTMASLRCGRDYLSIGTTILNAVVECLNGSDDTNPDAFTYDMLLAMLQKLSVREQQRINMIEAGLVEWLIHHLNIDGCKMSPYRLKYVTALLMNLSLHSKAQIKAVSEARLVISLLTDLLLTEHEAALPFISGALSHFLMNRNINDEGKRLGLESVLKYYRKRSSTETREYLDHIIKLHNREDGEDTEREEINDNDNDEYDLVEDELDEDDPVQNEAGELAGDILLASYYSLSENSHSCRVNESNSQPTELNQILHNREIIPRFFKEKNLIRLRPVTNSYFKEQSNSPTSLRTVLSSELKGEKSLKHLIVEENSCMMNLIDYTPAQNSKSIKPSFNFHSFSSYGISTIYQKSTPSNNSKNIPTTKVPLKDSERTIQSRYEKSDEFDQNYEISDDISKGDSKTTIDSSSSVPSINSSLLEAPDKLSSIASLERFEVDEKSFKEEEEAFLAKPKLQRTPPQTGNI